MEFKTTRDPNVVVDYISQRLIEALAAGKKVLWLVPGGSAIDIAVKVSDRLQGQDLSRLRISLTDERYGPPGHQDSNWQQLKEAGFLLSGAQLYPVLNNQDQTSTAQKFARWLDTELRNCNYKLGFFGIGPDGHTSGILPDSPAVTESSLACAYDGGAFQRVSTTPAAISQLDEAVVYASGEAKWPVLKQLADDLPLNEQPAQVLKTVPKLTVFTDYQP